MNRPFIGLAPMEGVIDPIMRAILSEAGGIDRTVTEFVRVTDQLLPAHVFYRYAPELLTGGRTLSGVPVFVQLLGGQPQPMAENAHFVADLGAPGVDLNFGCPAKTVNRHDGGAALLKAPERVFQVTEAVRRAVPAAIPVTAKVRLGFEHKEWAVDIAQAAASAGADSLTVHARTRLELYRPPAHWQYVSLMREAVPIPVIANGEIWSVEDYWECRRQSGSSGVALGRGLVARPDLALQIRQSLAGERPGPSPWQAILKKLISLFENSRARSDHFAVIRTKQWCKFLARQYGEAEILFSEIKTLSESTLIAAKLNGSCPPIRAD